MTEKRKKDHAQSEIEKAKLEKEELERRRAKSKKALNTENLLKQRELRSHQALSERPGKVVPMSGRSRRSQQLPIKKSPRSVRSKI